MLEQVLTHIHNWFRAQDGADGIHPGAYTIQNGGITLPFLRDGQYFRIMGSTFNDGLHRYQSPEPPDEESDEEATEESDEESEEGAPEEPSESVSRESEEEPEGPDLTDETFEGTVWALAVPNEVTALAAEMEEWEIKYGAKAAGMYKSESFSGYGYTKYTNGRGSPLTVWDVFQGRLNRYRRLREV